MYTWNVLSHSILFSIEENLHHKIQLTANVRVYLECIIPFNLVQQKKNQLAVNWNRVTHHSSLGAKVGLNIASKPTTWNVRRIYIFRSKFWVFWRFTKNFMYIASQHLNLNKLANIKKTSQYKFQIQYTWKNKLPCLVRSNQIFSDWFGTE